MILNSDLLEHLTSERLDLLAELDEAGLFAESGETFEIYHERLKRIRDKFKEISEELETEAGFAPFDDLKFSKDDLISDEIMAEAAEITHALYAFKIDWVPGFFLSTNLGMLWGGCAISVPEEDFSLFLIRKSFRSVKKWFIYRRDELLSHELCHIARTPLHDYRFEEYFAYQTSFSRLRRYMGNCFIYRYDAIGFIMPVMLLLFVQIMITVGFVQLPIWPFWITAGLYPLWLFIRNQLSRNLIHRARRKLAWICSAPAAVLFRCSASEIIEFAAAPDDDATIRLWQDKAEHELRWKIIDYRFNY
jgi:hypothetical protein